MRSFRPFPIVVSVILGITGGASAFGQTPNAPWVHLESTSVNVGIGGQSGDGMLYLPNLGTNCAFPFKVEGFGGGIHLGISKVSATGVVNNLTRVADLTGQYSASQGEVTLLAGGGGMSLKNRANNVVMDLKSETQGLSLGFGGQGMTIRLSDPPVNAPRAYVVEFGFNKTWLSKASRVVVDQAIRDWKCRFANLWVFGHTDTVGKEDVNLELAEKRAAAVREYLIGAGITSVRVMTVAKGEDTPRAVTDDNVRRRVNRAVGIVIQQ